MADADCSQRGLRLTFTLMGALPQPKKGFVPMADRRYLGASVHVGHFWPHGIVRFQPKWLTKAKALSRINHALASHQMLADEASKLRGDLMWMFSTCTGFLGKLAGPLLTEKQRHSDPSLTEDQLFTLRLLAQVVLNARPRDIHVGTQPPTPLVVYSGASFEQYVLRLGRVVFPQTSKPLGGTCRVPQAVISDWAPRAQQIFAGEAVCALVVPYLLPHTSSGVGMLYGLLTTKQQYAR